MRRFREFLVSELVTYRPQVTRIVGIYDLPDLGAATQLWQTPVGGYNSWSDVINWLGRQAQYNVRYPLEQHGIDPSRTDSEIRSLSYAQMKSAMIDLASRAQSIGSVLASEGTRPEDKHMTARLREAHFRGQQVHSAGVDDKGQPLPPTRTSVYDEGVDLYYIMKVDVRAFTGEVSGRGGTQGFKVGEALDVIVPTRDVQGEAIFGTPVDSTNAPPTQMPDPQAPPPHVDSLFDIDIRKLNVEMHKALQIFTNFERELASWQKMAGWGDTINQQLTARHLSPSLSTDPAAFR